MKENIYLRKIRKRERDWDTNVYPFSIPVIRDFTEFRFEKSVTYIVGGNGSGKSTLLEAIAVLLRINPEGGSRHFNFHTEETQMIPISSGQRVTTMSSPKSIAVV